MADAATLGSRLSAARAVTTAQTSGASASAPAAPTSADSSSSESTSTTEAKSTTPALDSVTSSESKTEGDESKTSTDDKSDATKTPEELTKAFVSLDKRQKKFAQKKKDWEANVKTKDEEHAKARKELISEHARITALQRHVEQKHAWVAKGQQAWDNSDPVEFAKAIEKMAKGASLAAITRWLAGAAEKPASVAQAQPSEEEQAWKREKAEHERQKAAEAAKGDEAKKTRDQGKQREEAKGRLAEAFAKHPFLVNPDDPKKPDPDALETAFGKVAAAMKHRKPGETSKQVATRVLDELHAAEVRRLKRLGLEPKTPAAASKKGEAKPETKEGSRLPPPPPTNKNAAPPSLDDTRAQRIAAAQRMTEQQRRGVL